jgi:diguanylate cyclase (GGDEF)-like protein
MTLSTPSDIAERSLAGSLPSLPTVALDVLQICQDPRSDISQLVDRMSLDPVLASRVLQMANSAYYNRGNEVTSLQRAAVMLGLRTLKVLALGFTLANRLPRDGDKAGFDLKQYWHRSLVNAVAARAIASAIRSSRREEAFVCGLLSQIGKLAIAQVTPEEYERVVELGQGWPSEEQERQLLGFTSSEVGESLLGRWGLPQSIVAAATHAERLGTLPDDAAFETQELAQVTALGVCAGRVLFDGQGGVRLKEFQDEAARAYKLSEASVDEVLESLQAGVLETAATFAIELPANRTYDAILAEARDQLMALSLNHVIDLEQTTTALAELTEENEALHQRALTDILTDLSNRAALEGALQREVEQRLRETPRDAALGILMIDIDTFKRFNDTYGHRDGDHILRTVATAMASVTRGSDLLARYGGDEFCMVLRQTTDAGAAASGERLRRTVENTPVTLASGEVVRVTISVGGAVSNSSDPAVGIHLIERADAALYEAKADGRNRVRVSRSANACASEAPTPLRAAS